MAEYITREEVCKLCDNKKEYCGKEKCPVYKAPTTDAVEVVRCGDCKWGTSFGDYEDKFTRCTNLHGKPLMPNNGFCSYGERREGE